MAFIDKLKQAISLTNSIQGIDNIIRFSTNIDFPGVVYYGREHVFNFKDFASAQSFVDSMNQRLDELFNSEKSRIEILAKEIFEPKAST